jgi:hypothetical protein
LGAANKQKAAVSPYGRGNAAAYTSHGVCAANSILNTACGVETTCRGGVAGAAYHECAAVSPYGGMKAAAYTSHGVCGANSILNTACGVETPSGE